MSEKRNKQERKNNVARLNSTNKDAIIRISPPICPACNLDPSTAKQEGFEYGFLMFAIPNTGVAHFVCPRCFVVMMNKECFTNQAIIKAKNESRIILP
jgi:hypothetical protein